MIRLPLGKVIRFGTRLVAASKNGINAAERQELLLEALEIVEPLIPAASPAAPILRLGVSVLRQLPGGLSDAERQSILHDLLELVAQIAPDELDIPTAA